ncbi:MAG: GntR family transcriptional regulator [Cetobacterium sp.]
MIIPTYLKVIKEFEDRIKNDVYKKGQMLPTENELCEEFSLSRMTIRKIIQELIERGKIYKIKGRGNFVSNHETENVYNCQGFSQNMKKYGYKIENLNIDLIVEKSTNYISSKLGISAEEDIFVLTRYRTINDEPILVDKIYIEKSKFSNFDKLDFENISVYKTFKDTYGLKIFKSEQSISTELIFGPSAEFLFGKSKNVALKIETKNFDLNNNIISFEETFYNGYKFKLNFLIEQGGVVK